MKTLYICGMEKNAEYAPKVAEYLLRIKAVELKPEQPFTWASGWKSPIYCDNRKTLSYVDVRDYIRDQFARVIRAQYPDVDAVVGVATGGIALGALAAQALDLPFAYVRSSAKQHGLGNQVEGDLKAGQKVVVIEDLVSTGKSSLTAVEALRAMGVEVAGMVAIFTYGFPVAEENFIKAACELHTLSDYDTLVKQALHSGYINEKTLGSLREWRKNPEQWSASYIHAHNH